MQGLAQGLVGSAGNGAGAHEDEVVVWANDGGRIRVQHTPACVLVAQAQDDGIREILVQVAKPQTLQYSITRSLSDAACR